MNKVLTSIKIPTALNRKIEEKVIAEGFGLRGKSRWIEEAVNDLLQLKDYIECVFIASDMTRLDKTVSFRVSHETAVALDAAVILVRQHHPAMEGVRSNIIRASIFQRFFRHLPRG